MLNTLESLLSSPWVNGISLVATLFFGLLGWFLWLKDRRHRKPVYIIRTANLFKNVVSEELQITVRFPGHAEPLTTLSVTRLWFKNDGATTIRKLDVAKTDPLRILCRNGRILKADIIRSSGSANGFAESLSREDNSVRITFDFMNRGDGVLFQIFHTASSGQDIQLCGTIVESIPIRRLDYEPTMDRWARVFDWFSLIGGLLALSSTVILNMTTAQSMVLGGLIGFAVLLSLIGVFVSYLSFRRMRAAFASELELEEME